MAEKKPKHVYSVNEDNVAKIVACADSARTSKENEQGIVTRKLTVPSKIFQDHMKAKGFDRTAVGDFANAIGDYVHDMDSAALELLSKAVEDGEKVDRMKIADTRNHFALSNSVDAKSSRQKTTQGEDKKFQKVVDKNGDPVMEITYGKISHGIGFKFKPNRTMFQPQIERLQKLCDANESLAPADE